MKKIYSSIEDLVGNTPMVRLHKWEKKYAPDTVMMAKCEFYNPLFSIKDRPALAMITQAEKEGKVSEDTIFVEATSGNMGIALSAFAAAKGYKLMVVMPENMSKERIAIMRYFGTDVILTPKEDGMKGAIAKVNVLKNKNPNVIVLDQFNNEANVNSHRFGTSIEILEETKGEIDVLVAGVGTSGTLSGIVSTLKSNNPDLYVVAVEPQKSSVLSGGKANTHSIMGIGAGFVPPLYEEELVDEVVGIKDDDAWNTAKNLAQIEGLPIGVSSGAALWAATQIAKRKDAKNKNIVVIFPDSINNYLSML